MLRITHLFAAACLACTIGFAACETTPPLQTLDQTAFENRMARAESTRPPEAAEDLYTSLLDEEQLTDDMRRRTLLARGRLRRENGMSLPGAIADFDGVLALNAVDAMAVDARAGQKLAREEVEGIEARRTSGRLQTIAQWFDDSWRLGERAPAAKRYQNAGLSPTQKQVRQLESAGFICRSGGSGGPVYRYGDRRPDLDGLTWCTPLEGT